ncbi:RNA polymerase sigma factor [Paenibacillus chitinolyticus]|uniref:RNA polymerase sigma factor n=1 Tax=Paenibacillus chitinolyticus TaxID=79263 RepID=UPI00355865C0
MESFADVYKAYADQVFRYVLSLTGDWDQAEELTQETFYRAFLHIGRFRGDSSLYTWLCKIARNLYLDTSKRGSREQRSSQQQRMQQKEENAAPQSRGDFAAGLVNREQATALHRVLHRMPEPYKEVFTLRVFGELKFREIAELFGRTEGWAKITYFRAKRRLIQQMEVEE